MSSELPAVPGVGGTGTPWEHLPPQAAIPLQPPWCPPSTEMWSRTWTAMTPMAPAIPVPRRPRPLPPMAWAWSSTL